VITIDRLKLTLPPGLEDRAHAVARRVIEELARLPLDPARVPASRRLDRLAVPPLTLDTAPAADLDDGRLARRIAEAVHRSLTDPAPGNGGDRP
jgi:hypothetical protein